MSILIEDDFEEIYFYFCFFEAIRSLCVHFNQVESKIMILRRIFYFYFIFYCTIITKKS